MSQHDDPTRRPADRSGGQDDSAAPERQHGTSPQDGATGYEDESRYGAGAEPERFGSGQSYGKQSGSDAGQTSQGDQGTGAPGAGAGGSGQSDQSGQSGEGGPSGQEGQFGLGDQGQWGQGGQPGQLGTFKQSGDGKPSGEPNGEPSGEPAGAQGAEPNAPGQTYGGLSGTRQSGSAGNDAEAPGDDGTPALSSSSGSSALGGPRGAADTGAAPGQQPGNTGTTGSPVTPATPATPATSSGQNVK